MRIVVYGIGLLVIFGLFTWGGIASGRKRAGIELQEFAGTVPAPLTDDVREWLRSELARRSTYPFIGMTAGMTVANIPFYSGWQEVPWYWFATLIGVGMGATAGALLAGYRTAPLLDGSVRTVDPSRRRVSGSFTRSELLRLRLAVLVAVAGSALALALDLTIASSGDTTSARRALVGCSLGALLVVAHYWVAATVIARPMVTSTPEGLLWQKALLAKTVRSIPNTAFLVAMFSAAIALFTIVAAYGDLPPVVLVAGGCFALMTAASAVSVTRQASRERSVSERIAS